MVLLPSCFAAGRGRHEVHWKFPRKAVVEITTTSSSCVVRQGPADEIAVDITSFFRPPGNFVPAFVETTGSVFLEEQMRGPADGSASWRLTVPEGTEVRFHSTSGNIRLSDAAGVFSLYSDAGSIEARNVTLTASSGFGTASGDVSISLAHSPHGDMFLYSRSGKLTVNYGGNPVVGKFRFEAKAAEGEIRSAVPFDTEENVDRNGVLYTVGTFRRESDTPSVRLLTSTGKAILVAR